MRQSDTINELAAALAKAQAKIEGAAKEAVNPHFRNKYADLGNVWAAIREPLTSNGLSVVQLLRGAERGVECETILMHSTGQYIAETLFVPVNKNDAQGYGSAATYARRYSLQAMVGIAPVDDDGEGARGKGDEPRRDPPPPPPSSFERGTPLADARRAIDAGTASNVRQGATVSPPGGTGNTKPNQPTAKEWAHSDDAKAWLARAATELAAISDSASIREWQDANAASINALDDHHVKRHEWLMEKINTRLDEVTNLRPAA